MAKWYQTVRDLHTKRGISIIVAGTSMAILFLILSFITSDDTYSIERFQLSPETIRSSKTVEDPLKTEQDRQAARESTDPVYVFQDEVAENQQAWLLSVFDSIRLAKEGSAENGSNPLPVTEIRKELVTLSPELAEQLTDGDIQVLATQPSSNLNTASEVVTDVVGDVLDEPIRSSQLTSARQVVVEQLTEQLPFSQDIEMAMSKIARTAVVETELLDEDLTEQRIQEAVDAVEPTQILQGQLLVQQGQYVDREIYRQLELTGMLSERESMKTYLGILILAFLSVAAIYMSYKLTRGSKKTRLKQLTVALVVTILTALLMTLTSLIDDNFRLSLAFLFPTAFGAMAVYLLTTERMAYVSLISTALLSGYLFKEELSGFLQTDISIYTLLGGLAGIFSLKVLPTNSQILRASAVVGVINALFMSAYLLLSTSVMTGQDVMMYIGIGFLSGMLSGAFTLGTLPFFESAFGILSTMKLLELASPGHPLIKKILIETPGTYHHSVMVANLSESACEAIGANGLFARVACYYHDIGKTRRPGFFIENQTNGYNPHDHLPPETSATIIRDHTTDGAGILREARMPRAITDIALQHHGTTCIKFFYHKAKKQDETVDEQHYRYTGPKPQTREAAVISIADSVEAAVRSMSQPSSQKISELVEAIVADRVQDGQFDECDISMKDLVTVKKSICSTLKGFYHERIEYPKEESK